jgi:sugar/nucleoside kinase (ribokinase family)
MPNMKDIVVVGSVAFDNIETIKGKKDHLLGGSGVYFSLAASLFTKTHLIGIVGDDFNKEYIDMFHSKSISTDYLIQESGKTFSWGGKYSDDFNHRNTLFTDLGVFEYFVPKIDSTKFNQPILFLANIQPSLQMDVINQLKDPSLIVMDTMNLWIDNNLDELFLVIRKVDILLINDEEVVELTGIDDVYQAGLSLLKEGPKYIIIKKGSAGSLIVSNNDNISIPAIPNIDVFDPTGAGDSFAGGFLGYLASNQKFNIVDAVLHGTAVASYTISGFGIEGIQKIKLNNIKNRIKLLNDLIKEF